jgi:hypothetical protein
MRTIFGREPAVVWSFAAILTQALLMLAPWSDEVHGAVNAAVLAAAGLLTAAWVSVDAALPAVAGLIKATFALVLAFGVQAPEKYQVAALAVVSAVSAFWVRTQVTARVASPVQGQRIGA